MQGLQEKTPVIVASEYPQVREVLRRLAQHQERVTVAGEAENQITTVALAKGAKSPLVLIDYRLPYFQGQDGNPLSRVYGLNAARTIAEEINAATAVVISNCDSQMELAAVLNAGSIPYLKVRSGMDSTLVSLQRLAGGGAPAKLLFAELAAHHPEAVRVSPRTTIRERIAKLSGLLSVAGIAAIATGLGLLLTVIFAAFGVVWLVGGALALAAGLVGSRVGSLGSKEIQGNREMPEGAKPG